MYLLCGNPAILELAGRAALAAVALEPAYHTLHVGHIHSGICSLDAHAPQAGRNSVQLFSIPLLLGVDNLIDELVC